MPIAEQSLVRAAAIGVACSVSFTAGLLVDSYLRGREERIIVQAILRSNELGQLLDSIDHATIQSGTYDELGKVKSLDDIAPIREKYRESVVVNIHAYERHLADLSPEKRRTLQTLHSSVVEALKKKYGIDP
jgi:hypothetical protein